MPVTLYGACYSKYSQNPIPLSKAVSRLPIFGKQIYNLDFLNNPLNLATTEEPRRKLEQPEPTAQMLIYALVAQTLHIKVRQHIIVFGAKYILLYRHLAVIR